MVMTSDDEGKGTQTSDNKKSKKKKRRWGFIPI